MVFASYDIKSIYNKGLRRDGFCTPKGFLVELTESDGMTGGGFGGCIVTLVQTNKMNARKKFLNRACKTWTGTERTLFSSRPAEATQVTEK